MWDAQTGALKWRSTDISSGFGIALVPSRTGVDVAVATEYGICLLDGATGEARSRSQSGRSVLLGPSTMWGVTAGALSTGEMFVAGAGHDHTVYRWSAETGSLLGPPMLGHGNSVKGIDVVGWTGQNPMIVSGDENDTVFRWNSDTGEQVGAPLSTGGELIAAGITPGTAFYFASADYDSEVRVWNAVTGLQIGRTISAHGFPTGLVLFDSDGSLNIVLATDDAVVGRWDVETGQYLGTLASGYTVAGGWLSAETVALAIGTTEGSLRIIPM